MNIHSHPIWKSISPFKKPLHLFRFFLARNVAKIYPRSTFIGITGSVGKTTTAKFAYAVLSQKFNTLSTTQSEPSNLDPVFNIPLTLLKVRPATQKVILELGIEHPEEIDFYFSLVQPAIGVITRIYYAHSEFLGDIEDIAKEKSKLIKQLPEDGFAIMNWDDPYVRKLESETKANVIFYGTDSKHCQVWANNIKIENFQTRFELNFGVERVEIWLKLLGRHQIYPALAAAALGISCGMSLITIKRGLETLEPCEHRLEPLAGVNGCLVIDDTYNNASPIGLEAAIDVLNELPARKRIVVIGEMRELGSYSELLHKQVAQKIYKNHPDLVLLGGGQAQTIAVELKELGFSADRLESGLSNSQMVSRVLNYVSKGDIVLVKGSRALRLDEVVKRIIKPK